MDTTGIVELGNLDVNNEGGMVYASDRSDHRVDRNRLME